MNFVAKQRHGWQVAVGAGLATLLGVSGGGLAWAQAGGAGGSGAGGGPGTTNPSCANATMFPSPIIVTGSSAFEPTVKPFAAKAAALTPPVTIIYNATGSCVGVGAVTGAGTALTGTGHAYKADPTSGAITQISCSFDTALKADLAVSDVFYESCGTARPATMGDFQGPVQAMLMIVNAANTGVNAISAAQAASIWGCGASGQVGTFLDDVSGIQQRDMNSGTQILVAKNIGVPQAAFKGHANSGGGALVASVANGSATQAIGFVAADTYKAEVMKSPPTAVRSLAFQGIGQTMAYYADGSATSNDRRNVRDGHYVIAGPEHLIVPLTNGAPLANAQKFIDWINGNTMIDAANPNAFIDLEALAGTIPQCAMKVTHTSDGGPLAPFTPCKPCGCYYESKANGGVVSPSCVACSATAPCAGGKTCSFGYCE
jgi:ABC-type phosphate transport system substrate-binding protein